MFGVFFWLFNIFSNFATSLKALHLQSPPNIVIILQCIAYLFLMLIDINNFFFGF